MYRSWGTEPAKMHSRFLAARVTKAVLRISEPARLKDMSLGRMLMALGLLVAALGALISLGEKLPIRLGRLPGDIIIRGKHSVFYFPLATCLLISLVLSLVLWLMNRR
jgi:hypothetical protein